MTERSEAVTQRAVTDLFRAIESRDLRAVRRSLSPTVSWQNVPHPAAHGRDAVIALLAGILTWSEEVSWDVHAARYETGRAWIERVDRFRIAGQWLDVRCNGVFEVDDAGRVSEVRDYVDLSEWRARVRPVLDLLAHRSPVEVVSRHLDAVHSGQTIAMASDYAVDAVLIRGSDTHSGWDAIADYFDRVPERLGGRSVVFDNVTPISPEVVRTRWSITSAGGSESVAGIDTFVVRAGRIVHQTVELLGDDF